jgi:hypothetical protein
MKVVNAHLDVMYVNKLPIFRTLSRLKGLVAEDGVPDRVALADADAIEAALLTVSGLKLVPEALMIFASVDSAITAPPVCPLPKKLSICSGTVNRAKAPARFARRGAASRRSRADGM